MKQRVMVTFRDGPTAIFYLTDPEDPLVAPSDPVNFYDSMPSVIVVTHDDGRTIIPTDVVQMISLNEAPAESSTHYPTLSPGDVYEATKLVRSFERGDATFLGARVGLLWPQGRPDRMTHDELMTMLDKMVGKDD